MRIAVFEHAPYEGPGAIATWAGERGHTVARIDATRGTFPTPEEYDAVVVMGGPMSANDDATCNWLVAEKRAVRAGIDAGKRVLGVCLGAQIVASVLGASVTRNPQPEIGWFPVTLSEAASASRVFGALPASFVAGHWHGDTFALPEGARAMASSDACTNQAFEYDDGRIVGLQFHLEWLPADVEALVETCAGDSAPGPYVEDVGAFVEGERSHGEACRALLYSLLDTFA